MKASKPVERWYDLRGRNGKVFNTVKAIDEYDAYRKSQKYASVIGIEFEGIVHRYNPSCIVELTPSGGKHPF